MGRVAAMAKLEEQFQACLKSLFAEMSDLRRMFEGKVPQGDNFRAEVEREVRKCTQDFVGDHSVTELARQLTSEKEERKMEDRSMHQLLAKLAEQTNVAMEEESHRIWEAIQSHNHDVILDAGGGGGGGIGNISVQTLTTPSGLPIPPKLARTINLSTQGSLLGNGQGGLQRGQAPPVQTLYGSSSRSIGNRTGAGMNQFLQSQQSQRPPQQSLNNNVIMESFNGSLKTYPRIRVPGVYPE